MKSSPIRESSPPGVHRSTLVIEIASKPAAEATLQLAIAVRPFPFELLKRPASYDWRQKSTTARILASSEEIELGQDLAIGKVDDSMTIRLGHLDQDVHWCTYADTHVLVHQRPLASDIVQGTLGNCWFLCALSLVAERRTLFERVLPTSAQVFATTKQAVVRLFRFGRWHRVRVDANLPANAAGHLIFSKAKRRQLYVPLIEKALAKLYEGYDHLVGGHLSEAMTTLTGYPCEILWLPPNRKLWSTTEEVAELLTSGRYEGTVRPMLEELWIRIVSFHSVGYLLSVSCGKSYIVDHVQRSILDDFESAEPLQRLGLLHSHAYSILDLRQIEPSGDRLVKLHNPWGTLVWNGKYSDWNPEGDDARREKGTFWIGFEDLARYFEQIIVGKVQYGWHEYAFEGQFAASWGAANEWSVFELCLPCEPIEGGNYAQMTATLYQGSATTKTLRRALFVVLYELCESATSATPVLGPCRGGSVCNAQNSVTIEAELKRGKRYLLGLFGFDGQAAEAAGVQSDYVLRVYSSRPIKIEAYRCPNMALLGDMIIGYTMATGEISRPQANVAIYQSARSWAGVVVVVKNEHPRRWLSVRVSVGIEGKSQKSVVSSLIHGHFKSLITNRNEVGARLVKQSRSTDTPEADQPDQHGLILEGETPDDRLQWQERYLVSSRGAFTTNDLLPPGHCQLINLVTIRDFMDKFILLTYNFDNRTTLKDNLRQHINEHDPAILTTYGLHSPRLL